MLYPGYFQTDFSLWRCTIRIKMTVQTESKLAIRIAYRKFWKGTHLCLAWSELCLNHSGGTPTPLGTWGNLFLLTRHFLILTESLTMAWRDFTANRKQPFSQWNVRNMKAKVWSKFPEMHQDTDCQEICLTGPGPGPGLYLFLCLLNNSHTRLPSLRTSSTERKPFPVLANRRNSENCQA